MKKIILPIIYLLVCVGMVAQEYKHYVPKLTQEQLIFRNYSLGIKVVEGDSLKLYSEPIFDKYYYHKQNVCARISFSILDGHDSVTTINCIWACLSKELNLKFLFPVYTEDVAFNETANCFEYTTHVSLDGCWYNQGLLDECGNIIYSAQNRSIVNVNNGRFVALEWRDNDEDEKEITPIKVSIGDIKNPSILKTVTIKVPSEVVSRIFHLGLGVLRSNLSKSDIDVYGNIFHLLLDDADTYNIKEELKILLYSDNQLVATCAKQNFKSLAKYSRLR